MAWDEEEDKTVYKVIVDSKNNYQLLPLNTRNPDGWKEIGKRGLKKECLNYIEEVWTDRKLSRFRK